MILPRRRMPMLRLLRSWWLALALSAFPVAAVAAESLKIGFGMALTFVQYRGIAGNDLEQFKRSGTQVILYPPAYKSGEFAYPYGGPS